MIEYGGIIYGAFLIIVFFVKNKFTEAMRLDKLIAPNASSQTRIINLLAGITFLGYGIYATFLNAK